MKYLIKKKATALRREQSQTGGGASKETPLNSFELRILSILGDTLVNGVGEEEVGHVSFYYKH